MSDDGADLGVTADRALKTVLGGEEQPSEEERKTPEQMREHLMSVPTLADWQPGSSDYGDTASVAGRAVLEFIEAQPEHRETPIENVYAKDADWSSSTVLEDSLEQVGLYDVMKDAGVDLGKLDLSGFMWGWAANAARYCLGLPAQPNPAIVEVRTG